MRSYSVVTFLKQRGSWFHGFTHPQQLLSYGSMSIAMPYMWFVISPPWKVFLYRMPASARGVYGLSVHVALIAASTHLSAGITRLCIFTGRSMNEVSST